MRFRSLRLFFIRNIDRFRFVANVIFPSALILMELYLGNYVIALFIFLCFLILLFSRQHRFFILAILILVIIIPNKNILATMSQLRDIDFPTLQHPKAALTNLFTANSGQDVLSGQVQSMLSLLQVNHLENYQLSNTLANDPLVYQRIIEAAWPIKMSLKSKYYFVLIGEINSYPTCTIIDQRKDVALAKCN